MGMQILRVKSKIYKFGVFSNKGILILLKINASRSVHFRWLLSIQVGSCLNWIFWEHENQSGLLVIWLIYIKLYRKKETKFWKKIWAKQEYGLTAVRLKWDLPVFIKEHINGFVLFTKWSTPLQ